MKNVDLKEYGINKEKLPTHIAIIMDGNGRWAEEKGLPRNKGHEQGVKSVRDIVETCGDIGIDYLTLYTFSEENWKRPRQEVFFLMRLLANLLDKELKELLRNNVKVKFIGRLHKLPKYVTNRIQKMTEKTKSNTGLTLTLAISYGGRSEIIDAVNQILKDGIKEISEDIFRQYLYDPSLPDPDLLIRTASEFRISNFLLYEIAYTELFITPLLWPEFRTDQLLAAIKDYQKRERKFGGLS